MIETAIYIHIPFCDHKCIYCDFYSVITKDSVNGYLDALKKEIDFYSTSHSAEHRKIISVFFGGGTPSLMAPAYLNEILQHLKKNFNVSENAEITMETNPGTVDKQKLIDFLQTGINRISIGIQSFNNDELSFLTRIHDSEKAIQTIHDARNAGFNNINIDLIFNLPGQTKAKWQHNLNIAASLDINHISAYSLILERGTILNKMVLDKKVVLQDDDYDADLYEYTIDFLTSAGYNQYEVSNFSKPEFECIHNKCYWEYKDYFGFGTSAHSFVNGKRWWNFSSAKEYINKINSMGYAASGSEDVTNEQKLEEYIMLALRAKGINLKEAFAFFGDKWFIRNKEYIMNLEKENFITFADEKIRLTKKGYAVCDEILLNLK